MIKSERGFTLIEVVIAMLLLGIIGVALLSGLATASMALVIADERATAESLARSQMEYVKNQGYRTAPLHDPPDSSGEAKYDRIADSEIPDGYTIWSKDHDGIIVYDADIASIIGVPWNSQTNQPTEPTDTGIQKVTVVIYHQDKEILTLEDYKVDR